MNSSYKIACIVAALSLSPGPLFAGIIEAEGVAAIKPAGVERARQLALQDAKDQVMLQAGVGVEISSAMSSSKIPLESSRMRAAAIIEKITIDREWQMDDYFHVHISANIRTSDEDASVINRKYKRKIAATPFFSKKSYNDIDDIEQGFSNELLRRLEHGNRFLTRKTQYSITANASGATQDAGAVVSMASMYDSQFLISGEIVDASISNGSGILGLLQYKQRHFEVDFFVYDGLTGALIASHRVDALVTGDVTVGRDRPFGSASFFSTEFGQAINKTINSAAELISKDLENLPFTAKVTKIVDGRIHIDAGATSFVAPGDKLVAYRRRREFSTNGYSPSSEYRLTETPIATVSIVQVQPLFSIGMLPASSKDAVVGIGDFVRFDFVGQNQN